MARLWHRTATPSSNLGSSTGPASTPTQAVWRFDDGLAIQILRVDFLGGGAGITLASLWHH